MNNVTVIHLDISQNLLYAWVLEFIAVINKYIDLIPLTKYRHKIFSTMHTTLAYIYYQ